MTAPAPEFPRKITYEAFHPFSLSQDPDVLAEIKGRAFDVREESRVLQAAKELYDRLRRWVSDTNKRGPLLPHLTLQPLAHVPRERAGFVPRDRLFMEVDGHEQVFNSDPLARRNPRPGGVFLAETDFSLIAVNFDLRPFIEAYVRRLSALAPDLVWRVDGPGGMSRYYVRANGFTLKTEPTPRLEPRRFPVPKPVVDAFGPMRVVPLPPVCAVCGKQDERVALQPDPKLKEAHAACMP